MVKPPKTALLSTQDELIPYPPEQSPFYITRKDQERPIRLAKTGIASRPPRTIPQLLEESAKKNKNKLMFAIEWPEPALDMSKKDQGPQAMIPPALPLSLWKSWTYSQGFEEIKMAAKGFIALGFKPLDTVSILGFNSPFWGFGAFAAIYAGGINNGMYGTDTDEQIVYKVQNSGTTIVLVDNETNYRKFYQNINEMPSLKAIVVWKDEKIVTSTNMTVQRKDGTTISVLTWEQLLKKGEKVTEETLQERVDKQRPGKCCTLVFTSGTTGMPKAVMISHDNVYFQTLAAEFTLGDFYKSNPLILISYLPLSHIAGFTLDIASTLSSFSSFHTEVYFARSYDLKYGSLRDRLVAVRPNFFFGVPRVWEKFQEAIAAKAPKKGFKKNLAAYAKKKAFKVQVNQQIGGSGSVPFGAGISGKILGKVHKALGLDRLNYALSGAAPIKQETLKYWGSLGIYIGEVYGMSENAGCCTTTTNKHRCWGSVGGPEFATEVKVFIVNPNDNNDKKECPPAESLTLFTEENQGELCYRGRHIMLGYLANPEMGKEHIEDIIKKNEAAIDKEGWLHSGDKGLVTKAGFFKITGRYKELIIGAGGENIAPVPIEDDFKARCGGVVSNVMMIGNERKYNVAVVTLLCEGATGELPGTNILAGAAKTVSSAKTIEEACSDEKFVGFLLEKLNETNSNGKVITNQTFKIQKLCVLPKDFSVEQGELTPTLKLKRNVVEKKYEKMIDRIYETEGVFIKYQQE